MFGESNDRSNLATLPRLAEGWSDLLLCSGHTKLRHTSSADMWSVHCMNKGGPKGFLSPSQKVKEGLNGEGFCSLRGQHSPGAAPETKKKKKKQKAQPRPNPSPASRDDGQFPLGTARGIDLGCFSLFSDRPPSCCILTSVYHYCVARWGSQSEFYSKPDRDR